jgi:hypothetical protein
MKRWAIPMAVLASAGLVAARTLGPGADPRSAAPQAGGTDGRYGARDVDLATVRYLQYVLLPLWIVPGFADYLYHRQTKIEHTAGTHESLLHALMLGEVGVPITLGLFLEIDAGVIAVMLLALIAHTATAFWDVAYAENRRTVPPNEQHCHSCMEVLPFTALSFVLCLHWDQALALLGRGPARPRFAFRRKRPPLPVSYVIGLLAAITAFVGVPHGEELVRCYRVDRTFAPRPPAATSRPDAPEVPAGSELD